MWKWWQRSNLHKPNKAIEISQWNAASVRKTTFKNAFSHCVFLSLFLISARTWPYLGLRNNPVWSSDGNRECWNFKLPFCEFCSIHYCSPLAVVSQSVCRALCQYKTRLSVSGPHLFCMWHCRVRVMSIAIEWDRDLYKHIWPNIHASGH